MRAQKKNQLKQKLDSTSQVGPRTGYRLTIPSGSTVVITPVHASVGTFKRAWEVVFENPLGHMPARFGVFILFNHGRFALLDELGPKGRHLGGFDLPPKLYETYDEAFSAALELFELAITACRLGASNPLRLQGDPF